MTTERPELFQFDLLIWADGQSERVLTTCPGYFMTFGRRSAITVADGWSVLERYGSEHRGIVVFQKDEPQTEGEVVLIADFCTGEVPPMWSCVGFRHYWHLLDWLRLALPALRLLEQEASND